MVAPSPVLESLLSHEYVCFQEANESRPVQNLRKARRRLLAHVREVVQRGDLEHKSSPQRNSSWKGICLATRTARR